MISNMGGCLTPIGDPPLFNGIYAWCSILLELTLVPDFNFQYDFIIDHFLLIDKKQYRKDIANGLRPDISKPGVDIKVEGLHNIVSL